MTEAITSRGMNIVTTGISRHEILWVAFSDTHYPPGISPDTLQIMVTNILKSPQKFVFIPGDLVDKAATIEDAHLVTKEIGRLSSTKDVFFVPGNDENSLQLPVKDALLYGLREQGVTVLEDEHQDVITDDGSLIRVIGLTGILELDQIHKIKKLDIHQQAFMYSQLLLEKYGPLVREMMQDATEKGVTEVVLLTHPPFVGENYGKQYTQMGQALIDEIEHILGDLLIGIISGDIHGEPPFPGEHKAKTPNGKISVLVARPYLLKEDPSGNGVEYGEFLRRNQQEFAEVR